MKQKLKLFFKVISLVLLFSSIFLKPTFAQYEDLTNCQKCEIGVLDCDADPECYRCGYCVDERKDKGSTPPPKSPSSSYTQEEYRDSVHNPVLPDILSGMPGATFLQNLLRTGIGLLFIAGAVIFFIILGSGGIKWLSSSGDKVKLESAQKQVTSGLVGLAILLSVYAIIQLINTLFGIDLLNLTLPTLNN